MPQTERCVLYARKSTDREDKQILSIPAQLNELRRFAERCGLVITDELVEHCSAREPGRPIFSKLLQDIATGKVARVLSWKLDRLARNPIDGGALIHYLGKGLLTEIITPEGRYTGQGDSKFMLSVLFGAATKMTDDLADGVKRGNRAIHESGRITGVPPLGYMKVRDKPGYRGAGRAVPDPARFEIVKRIWQGVLAGATVAEMWRKATTDWGLTMRPSRGRQGHAPSVNYIYDLLQNRFYAGQIVRCGEVFQGEHKPMITVAEFEHVQRRVQRADASCPSKNLFLYRGLLHCGACTRLLTGERIKGRFVYYRCGRRRFGRTRCAEPAPTEDKVTRDVEQSLERLSLPKPVVDWTLAAVDHWLDDKDSVFLDERRRRDDELKQVDQQLTRLTDLLVSGTLSEEDYISRKSGLLARREALTAAIQAPDATAFAWRAQVHTILTDMTTCLPAFRNGQDDDQRETLGRVYENFIVKDRIVTPVLRFPFFLLDEARPDTTLLFARDENLPDPSRIVVNQRKNACRDSTLEHAFLQWWTLSDSNRRPPRCKRGALPTKLRARLDL